MSRREAILKQAPLYFTGVPCPRGHISPRRTSQADCVQCNNLLYRSAPKPRKYLGRPGVSKVCTGCKTDKPLSEYFPQKTGRFGVYGKCRVCYQAKANRLRSRLRQATPAWLSAADRQKMEEIWKQAAALGMSVDHIVPINGRRVCGLNVPWNLQIIPLVENLKKGNRYPLHIPLDTARSTT